MISKFFEWLFSGSCCNPRPETDREMGKLERELEHEAANEAALRAKDQQASIKSTRSEVIPHTLPGEVNNRLNVGAADKAPSSHHTSTSPATSAPVGRQRRAVKPKPPIELRLGLDVGTSCTKAVIGNNESGKQTVVPLAGDGGHELRSYLLPTKVYLGRFGYSLDDAGGAKSITNLKLRLLEHSSKGQRPKQEDLEHLVAFVALALRRVLDWHALEHASIHDSGRVAKWSLTVGLPARRLQDDVFAPTYTKITRAAVLLARADCALTPENVSGAVENASVEVDWLPHERISLFPEASAQLVSLLRSPFCPQGCLLLVDVGAGTLDVSTLRVSSNKTESNCFLQCTEVAPLGVHFLQMERQGLSDAHALDLSAEDVICGYRASSAPAAEARFSKRCQEPLLATVARYRKLLRSTHQSPTFKPWNEGLTYILSGGGHRDPFYQSLLKHDLREWMKPIVSEWTDDMAGLKRELFRAPNSFEPKSLSEHFDRFSVAHGLSLDPANLLNTGQPN